jgi:hypothetical protein
MPSRHGFLGFLVWCSCVTLQSLPASAQPPLSHPNFRLEFDQFIPNTSDTHTDTHNIVVGKPVKTLTLSMISSGDPELGDMHLPGSEILLDLSNAIIHDSTNSASELSISVEFNDPLPIGTYPATKVVFGFIEGYFHGTMGRASGTFFDGEPFEVEVAAGFIPEPSSISLFALAAVAGCVVRRRRRCRATIW